MSHTEADPPAQTEAVAQTEPATSDRLTALESAVKRIEQALAGNRSSSSAPPPDDMAELVRKGVEELRVKEQAQAEREAKDAQQKDHETRLAALEERPPSETAATPAGKIRSGVQKWFFGVDQPRK